MRITCKRRIQFCAGHRILNHESKCNNVHGHNYVLWVYAEAPQLDSLGRVIDFSELKNRIGGWIDQNLDHSFIAFEQDTKVLDFVNDINDKKPYILKFNPTAENIAAHLLDDVIPELMKDTEIFVSKLELFETENCSVEVKKY